MSNLIASLLTLIIIIAALALILGFPAHKVSRVFIKGVFLLVILVMIAPYLPALENLARNANTPQEFIILIAIGFLAFLFLFGIIFGAGSVSNLVQRLIASAIYDILKGIFRVLHFSFRNLIGFIFRLR